MSDHLIIYIRLDCFMPDGSDHLITMDESIKKTLLIENY